MDFNLDDFIAGINKAQSQKQSNNSNGVYINKLTMSSRDHQGTVGVIPILSGKTNNFYTKLPDVNEVIIPSTSLIPGSKDLWVKILPITMYPDLDADERALYSEVVGLMESLKENEFLNRTDGNWRRRTYSLFHGICYSFADTSGNPKVEVGDRVLEGNPFLFIYPNTLPISSLSDSITSKINLKKGRKEWLTGIFSPVAGGRDGVMLITFKIDGGNKYNCSVQLENGSIDDDYEVPEEIMELFKNFDPIKSFLGWNFDKENNRYFHRTMFQELRDYLKLELINSNPGASVTAVEPVTENKNDLKPATTKVEQVAESQQAEAIEAAAADDDDPF